MTIFNKFIIYKTFLVRDKFYMMAEVYSHIFPNRYTPLHQAAQQGHTQIVNLLLENKAEPNAETKVSYYFVKMYMFE